MPHCELAWQRPDGPDRGPHDLLPSAGKKAEDRCGVCVHRVLGDVAKLEEDRVQVTASDDLFLDRLLHPFDGNQLVANQ